MGISELEQRVAEIRAKPLQLVCITTTGRTRSMTVRECQETRARFLHVATDELDVLLGAELGATKNTHSRNTDFYRWKEVREISGHL